MKTRALLFDLGNVLIDYRPEIFASRLSQREQIPKERILAYFIDAYSDSAYIEGKISSDEFFNLVRRELNLQCSKDEFRDFWCDIFFAKQEMEDFIQRLHGRYPLWILSNTNEWHFEFLKRRYPVLDLFTDHFLSHELKCQKPQPEIFEHVIRKTGFKPQEIFFTDDLEVNVLAARRAGFEARLFTSESQLKKDFEELGVLNGSR